MSQTQDEAAKASARETEGAEVSQDVTLPDGFGGVITRTAPSTSGETFAGGTIVENDVGDSVEELMKAIEETIKPFDEGDIVSGHIVKIDKDEVLLDIGYKSEGVIPLRELSIRNDVDPHDVVSLGDAVEALVTQKEDADGRLILSKKRAQYERAWGRIEQIKNSEDTVEGPVIEVVKGGLILDIGLRGFLPASLVEMRRVRDLAPYVGKILECRIIELDKNRNNVVLSRRKFLEESQAEQRQEFLTSLTKGEVRVGTVSSIVNFGAFVDLGGVDGLVHVSELSWKHVDHPSEVVDVGKEVNVEVLDVDLERERVSLSLKATQEDPWRQFARMHEIGETIEGRVTKLVPFGAFVELDDAIEGLVHISELADHHVDKAEDEVSVHDRVPVKIIDIDLDRRRISLSRKQAMQEEVAPTETTTAAEMELEPEAGAQATPDVEMELEPADIEIETRTASEDIGVATEDTIQRPQSDADLIAAVEGAPEMADEPSAPETAVSAEAAGEVAPPEEREEAEAISMMAPDSPPEGHEGLTAAESDKPNMEVRIGQEEREPGATPGLATEEVIVAEEEDSAPVAEGFESARTEALDPADATSDESIEDIVEDIKRRGQS
ncbi:MAG: 30S ribosomal protein S1 [Actinobacteria bacterium]|nr:30S ribosomal protein S1 [Actinomycetota bacterium]